MVYTRTRTAAGVEGETLASSNGPNRSRCIIFMFTPGQKNSQFPKHSLLLVKIRRYGQFLIYVVCNLNKLRLT